MDKYYRDIKNLIENNLVEVRKQELSSNYHTLRTYYEVGKLLNEAIEQSPTKYGLLKTYAISLTNEYGKGYDLSNLRRMRDFYNTFSMCGSLSHTLNWTHYRILLPIKCESKRNYYINSCIEHSFSVRQLKEYMKSNAYERLVKKDNIKLKYIDNNQEEIKILDMIKKPILITMNKSVDKITEKALKKFMLEQIEKTMIELGAGFCFAGSEIPIKIDNKILRPDLVFFNTEFDCYVIIELKLKELTIRDIGQLEFYVKYYDNYKKKPYYNPTVGITISKKTNKSIVELNEKDNIKHTIYELIETKNM